MNLRFQQSIKFKGTYFNLSKLKFYLYRIDNLLSFLIIFITAKVFIAIMIFKGKNKIPINSINI